MSDYNEGDLVEAVKGEQMLRGRLISTTSRVFELALPTAYAEPEKATFVAWLLNHGWTLTVIERATPALPTEPFTTIRAVYLPAGNANTKTTHLTLLPVAERNERVTWSYSNGIRVDDADLPRIQSFEVVAAPVAETAKNVLNRLYDLDITGATTATLDAIAAEFGVTGGLGE